MATADTLRIHLIAAFRLPFDCNSVTALFRHRADFHLLSAEVDLLEAVELCRRYRPDAVLFDAGYPGGSAFSAAESLIESKSIDAAMFLDDEVHLTRVRLAVKSSQFGYMTREYRFDELCSAIGDILAGRHTTDQIIFHSSHSNGNEKRPISEVLQEGVLGLTDREIDVMRLLAIGYSVKETATELGISPNTVESHKENIMRQLEVNKTSQITRIAMREGMID